MLQAFGTLLVLAVICEAAVQWVKEAAAPLIARYVKQDPDLVATAERLAALVVGILLAVGAGQDLLALLGVAFRLPVVGIVLAGLAISRGAGYVHELIDRLNTAAGK